MRRTPFLTLFLILAVTAVLTACGDGGGGRAVYSYYSADTPLPIPDEDFVLSDVAVAGAPPFLSRVSVTVAIVHTYVSDLDIILWSPEGTSIYLVHNDSEGQDFWYTTFDDSATVSIMDTDSRDDPRTGYYRPNTPLAFFDGEDPNGIWTLEIDDTAAEDFGYLIEWSLDIQ